MIALMVIFLLLADVPPGQTPVAPIWSPSRAWPGLKLLVADKALVVVGVAGLVVLGLVGLGTGLRRMYAYALLGAVFSVAGHLLGTEVYYPVLGLGGAIGVIGIVVLVRFVRRPHPVPPTDEPDAGERGPDATR